MAYVFINIAGEVVYVVVVGGHGGDDDNLAQQILGYVPGAVRYSVCDSWDIADDGAGILEQLETTGGER